MDDPMNPYFGQYAQWDRWLYEHRCDPDDLHFYHPQPDDPPNWLNIKTRVDDSGYPLPMVENYRINHEVFRDRRNIPDVASCSKWARAYGEMDPALIDRMQLTEITSRAEYLPPIPAWLADSPPLWSMFLPDGEIVCLGEPGSGTDYLPDSSGVISHMPDNWEGECWYRYLADGTCVGQSVPGSDWWRLFFPNFDEVKDHYYGLSEDTNCIERNGYIVFYDMRSGERYPYYNYDGTEMPEGHRLYDRDNHGFAGLQGGYLQLVYDTQQALAGTS